MNQEKIEEFEEMIDRDYDNIAGIAVLKDGRSVYEHSFHGCTAQSRIHVYSVTKSVLSILIGIAADKGYIQSTDLKVLDFLPCYAV